MAVWLYMGLPGQLLHSGGQVIHGLAFLLLTAAQTFPSSLPLNFPLLLLLKYLRQAAERLSVHPGAAVDES